MIHHMEFTQFSIPGILSKIRLSYQEFNPGYDIWFIA